MGRKESNQTNKTNIYKKRHFLTFDFEVIETWNIAQYPLHHVTYTPAKFEVAMFNLLEDAFTKDNIWP